VTNPWWIIGGVAAFGLLTWASGRFVFWLEDRAETRRLAEEEAWGREFDRLHAQGKGEASEPPLEPPGDRP
jgi:hypothetical protein